MEIVVDQYLLSDEEIDMFKGYLSDFRHSITEIVDYVINDTSSIQEVE